MLAHEGIFMVDFQARRIFEKFDIGKMNKLGMSPAETKKYDALKIKRDEVLKDVVVLLEKTISIDTKNRDAKEVLLTVYKALEMKEKSKVLEAELKSQK